MYKYSISQLPVMDGTAFVGSLNESTGMKVLHDRLAPSNQEVSAIMAGSLPVLGAATGVAEAYRVFLSGAPAIVITRNKEGIGLITRADLIASWSKRHRATGASGEEDGHAV